jgi:hypothetical protein
MTQNAEKDWHKEVAPVTRYTTLRDTLAARGKTYGPFEDQAILFDSLLSPALVPLMAAEVHPAYKAAVIMIAQKLSRLLSGDINHTDSWHDIAGYATLAEDFAKKVSHGNNAPK